jgi:hypothetical protein
MPQSDDEYGLEPAKKAGTAVADEDEYGLEKASGAAAAPEEEATEENLPGSTPLLRAAVNKGVAKMKPPTPYEKEVNQDRGGVISQGLGTIGRQIKGWAASTVAPYTKGYEQYEQARQAGMSVPASIGAGVVRGIGNAAMGEDPLEKLQQTVNIPKDYKERREAGYGPIYSAAAPQVAGAVGVDLPTMEEAARVGNTPGVIAEAAVPAGEVLAGEAAHSPLGQKILRAPIDIARGTPLTEEGRLAAAGRQALTVKKPSMSETEYAQKVNDALPDLQRVAQDNPGVIKTPREAVGRINNRIGQMEEPISQHLSANPGEVVSATDYANDLHNNVDQALRNAPTKLTEKEIAAAKNKVDELFNQEGDQPLGEIEKIRRRLNTEAEDYFNSRPADKRVMDASDATAIAQRAAADYLRQRLYGTDAGPGWLERAGVTAVNADGKQIPMAEFRRRVGNLIEVRNHFEDAITRAENTGDWSPFQKWRSGPSLAAGGIGAIGGLVAGGPFGALLGSLAGEGMKAWGDYLHSKNPNLNVEKMFRNLERTGTPNVANIQTRQPIVDFPQGQGAMPPAALPQHGPVPPPGNFQMENLRPNQTAMWQQQVGAPPPLETGAPSAPYREPIGPQPAPEAPIPPIQGQQLGLHIPGGPEEAPLFNVNPINAPKNVPDIGGAPPPEVPSGEAPPKAIGGPGREGALERMQEAGEKAPGDMEQIPYTKPMKMAPSRLRPEQGLTDEAVHHHELAHAIVGALNDLEPGAIISHREPGAASRGTTAAAEFNLRGFTNVDTFTRKVLGVFKRGIEPGRADALTDLFAAGAAANELMDGLPRDKNPGLAGDRKLANDLFGALGFESKYHDELWNSAIDRAKEKLTPEIQDIIRDEATRREDNLPVQYHYSENRVKNIVKRARGGYGTAEEANAPGAVEAGNRVGAENVTGREGAGAQEPRGETAPEKLKPFKPPQNDYHFRVRPEGEEAWKSINLSAIDSKTAWKKLGKVEGGYSEAELMEEKKPTIGAPTRIATEVKPMVKPGTIVPPESSRVTPEPTPPPGDRWTADRGAIPGEAGWFLDGDKETAKAAITEVEDARDPGRATYEVHSADGDLLGKFGTIEEAARHAEKAIPPGGEVKPMTKPGKETPGKMGNAEKNEFLGAIAKLKGDTELADEQWEDATDEQRAHMLDRYRGQLEGTAPRTTPVQSADKAIDALKERVKDQTHKGQERDYKIWPKGELDPNKFYATTFLLDDGSAITGDKGIASHMQLARELGKDHLNDANAVRMVTPDSYELHGIPSEEQLAEMRRYYDGLRRENRQNVHDASHVYWDFYPSDVTGYSADAVSEKHETGAGSFSDFRRAIDEYYTPSTTEFGKDDVRVSPRVPSAAKATENGHTSPLQVGLDAVLNSPPDNKGVPLAKKLADTVRQYPGMDRVLKGITDPKAALEKFINHISDNLEWLHNQMPEEVRNYTKQWYDSAHEYTKKAAEKHGYDHQQSAGAMASQSPQKDWDMNVSLHDRILDIYKNHQDTVTTPEMFEKMKELDRTETENKIDTLLKRLQRNKVKGLSQAVIDNANDLAARGFRNAAIDAINKATKLDLDVPESNWKETAKAVKGKTLGELPTDVQAAWLRAYDEAHNPSTYEIHAPDGTSLGLARNADKSKTPSKVAWGTTPSIEKAINILRDGSRENISRNLGAEHKVRSFYNNIIDPNGKHGDVTIDTHAVAAGTISPHSGHSTEVEHNFGGPGSSVSGSSGTYPLYAEAYRRAADRLGLLPRQLQSIVWEQIRDLYPDTFKTEANHTKVENIWKDFGKGKLSLEEARNKVVEAAGGFKPPEWLEHVRK